MATTNRSFSKCRRGIACLAVVAVTGCAGQSVLGADGFRLSILEPKTEVRVIKAEPAPQLKPTIDQTPTITPVAAQPPRQPAWCDYLIEDTAAQTTIMRSPRLSASTSDDGKSNVSLGMSLSDLAKARLLEDTAEARCRRYVAESGLQKLIFLSPQELTSAGYRAKYNAVNRRKNDIQVLRRDVAKAMAQGDFDREKATMLMGIADQIFAEAANAKSQADRRSTDFLGQKDHAGLLGRELSRAEADLEDLNSRMRTYDAIDVSVSAGWSDDITRDDFQIESKGLSGKVSLSMKLGALAPQRFEHEERAKRAKLRAINEEGGTLWQVNVLRLAHERAIEGLVQSSSKIDNSITEARKLLAALKGVNNPEFAATKVQAKLRLIQLETEKAGVQGSIAEIRSNMARLKTAG
jgi:hypothetical protein